MGLDEISELISHTKSHLSRRKRLDIQIESTLDKLSSATNVYLQNT